MSDEQIIDVQTHNCADGTQLSFKIARHPSLLNCGFLTLLQYGGEYVHNTFVIPLDEAKLLQVFLNEVLVEGGKAYEKPTEMA